MYSSFADVELLSRDSLRGHYPEALAEVVVAIDGGWYPLVGGSLIEEELAVDAAFRPV